MTTLSDKVKANLKIVADQVGSENFDAELIELLSNTDAVIAGGFVLGSINNSLSSTSDLDIYVRHANFRPLLAFLLTRGRFQDFNISSPYDSSFFNKNGILARFGFSIYGKYVDSETNERGGVCAVDLMVLKEGRGVIDTVSNFDFTFCEVWFDGVDVNGTHLKDTLAFKGKLREEYLPAFLTGNKFTMARYAKYLNKGYTIDLGKIVPGVKPSVAKIDVESFIAIKVLTTYIMRIYRAGRYRMIDDNETILCTADLLTSNIDTLIEYAMANQELKLAMKQTLNAIANNIDHHYDAVRREDYTIITTSCESLLEMLG